MFHDFICRNDCIYFFNDDDRGNFGADPLRGWCVPHEELDDHAVTAGGCSSGTCHQGAHSMVFPCSSSVVICSPRYPPWSLDMLSVFW
jgi:hypothetical protein